MRARISKLIVPVGAGLVIAVGLLAYGATAPVTAATGTHKGKHVPARAQTFERAMKTCRKSSSKSGRKSCEEKTRARFGKQAPASAKPAAEEGWQPPVTGAEGPAAEPEPDCNGGAACMTKPAPAIVEAAPPTRELPPVEVAKGPTRAPEEVCAKVAAEEVAAKKLAAEQAPAERAAKGEIERAVKGEPAVPAPAVMEEKGGCGTTTTTGGWATAGTATTTTGTTISPGQLEELAKAATLSQTPPASAVAVGGKLFAEVCTSCHGPNGEGGRAAPNLREASAVKAQSVRGVVEELVKPEGNAPNFDSVLSFKEKEELGAYVCVEISKKCEASSGTTTGTTTTGTTTTGTTTTGTTTTGTTGTTVTTGTGTTTGTVLELETGRTIFTRQCESCHGPMGEGVSGRTPGYGKELPRSETIAGVVEQLNSPINEKGCMCMPSYSTALSSAEKEAVALYITVELTKTVKLGEG